ncbi:MAG: M1 family metallopeptidase [Anaerolineae bacterium]|nr:M1 family metallopeptidase [Anaerolineae bacterium]
MSKRIGWALTIRLTLESVWQAVLTWPVAWVLAVPLTTALVFVVLGTLSSTGDGHGARVNGQSPIPPTQTPPPPTLTPTATSLPYQPIQAAPVVWDDVTRYRAAMRPGFKDDVDRFVDAPRYTIEAQLVFEDDAAIIRGVEQVRYTNHSPDTLGEIVFRLYANLPALGGRMVVQRAEINGDPVEMTLIERESALLIPLDRPLKPGAAVEVVLEFSTTAERGLNAAYSAFGFQDNVFVGPEWYPALSVYEPGSGWWTERASTQGEAVYSESGLYDVRLTVPEDFTVLMSGTEIDPPPGVSTSNPVDTTLHHIVSGPMRDSLLVAGPDLETITGLVDDIAVRVSYWPDDTSRAAAGDVLRMAQDALRIYSETFGPYPFAELDIVETFNPTGIEYPGVIVIADRLWTPDDPALEMTIAHEVAHQWWYGLVGNNQVGQPWLDEALASYSEYVYTRAVHGEDAAAESIRQARAWYAYYLDSGAPDLPLNLPVSDYADSSYDVIIFIKGPLFFVELETRLGRAPFLDALRLYFTRHRYGITESRDMRAAFEDATGAALDALFAEWVGDLPE